MAQKRQNRRGSGEGTLYKQTNGKWRAQLLIGYRADGTAVRWSCTASTKAEAAQKLAMEVASGQHNVPTQAQEIAVKTFADYWLKNWKRLEVCSKTLEQYISLVQKHIVPMIGNYTLVELSTQHIQVLINSMAAQGYSVRQLNLVRTAIRQMYRIALQMQLVQKDPVAGVVLPKRPREQRENPKKKAIDPMLRVRVLEAAANDEGMYTVLLVLMLTGIRIGELLALQWKHVLFDTQEIIVEQAALRRPQLDETGCLQREENVVGPPKTDASYRTMRVCAPVVEALKKWKEHQHQSVIGQQITDSDGFVFCNSRTGGMRTYTGFRSVYYKFLDRYQLPRDGLNLHAYRHTFATIMLENGVNPKVVQELMGHSSVYTTLNVYTHVTPSVVEEVMRGLDSTYETRLR